MTHKIIHPFLTHKDIEKILDFIEILDAKSTEAILPHIFIWVKNGQIDMNQFKLLVSFYYPGGNPQVPLENLN